MSLVPLMNIVKTVKGKDITKVSPDLYDTRMRICENCPFFNKTTKSCGTLMVGGTVEYEGKEMELCGCHIPTKALYKDDGCPLGKW